MGEVTLAEAAARYAQGFQDASRQAALSEISRFVHWFGPDHALSRLKGHGVSLYADVLGPATPETSKRADYIRAFLAQLKKMGLIESSLAPHLRLKKGGMKAAKGGGQELSTVELTSEGVEALKSELEALIGQRAGVREAIRLAMMDKDFRENSPLDAAKDKQGHLEAQIREIEAMLRRAVVVEGSGGGKVKVGTTVVVKNLGNERVVRYLIVGPTEANAADGKISSESPVGKALLNSVEGDEVEVSAPAGTLRFRVEGVEG